MITDTQLMEEQFTATLDSASVNDRRYPRYQTPVPVSIIIREDSGAEEFSETVSLQNISLTGLYFNSKRTYAEGCHLEVMIALGERHYQIRVLVQRCAGLENNDAPTYGVAVLFVRGAEIHPFLAELAAFLKKNDANVL